MKNIFKSILYMGLLGVCLASCDNEDEGVAPSAVANLRYETTPGRIVLRWDTPDDGTVKYIRVSYYDQALKKEQLRVASVYADSVNIPDTRAKYGEYAFSVTPVGIGEKYGEAQKISATSEPAAKTWTPSALKLTGDMLSSNAQEPSEGPIADLLDDNTGSFFHTAWSEDIPGPHYMTIALPTTIDAWWQFYYAPRANAGNKPIDFDLEGSTDGKNWSLIKKFTKDADNLPVDSKTTYTSPRMDASEKPFSYLRMVVYDTNTHAANGAGGIFWTMSEFKVYTVALIDPEAPDED